MLKDRLLKYIDSKRITKSFFEKSIGAGNGYLSNVKTIGSDKLEDILNNYPDLDIEWLLTGRGNMQKIIKEIDSLDEINRVEPELSIYRLKTDYYGVERQRIPLYEIDASAGLNLLFSSQNTQIPLDYITVPNAPKCDGALFVRGDSMYPILKAGDIICYKTIHNFDNLIHGEMYVLDIDNGDDQFLTVKFVQKSDKGDKFVKLVSENKHHADRDISVKSIKALAIIKLSIRYNTIS
ncbi:conserved hypothetical protein [uncultured Dysgonomonas sp.]|uniref:Peptidase S24/S26A/S26B/S26C domain-containing protein n=1 Tax=uncultured Dysgonomonas sp. TaxID=206096 RepID=A0A212KB74_9BACT|nr:S24 family peptidase [uncultured Dysgonomonas sp.]SBW08755.1 conserved hypothetical protein [uncultured Dysgonomonas sp.]